MCRRAGTWADGPNILLLCKRPSIADYSEANNPNRSHYSIWEALAAGCPVHFVSALFPKVKQGSGPGMASPGELTLGLGVPVGDRKSFCGMESGLPQKLRRVRFAAGLPSAFLASSCLCSLSCRWQVAPNDHMDVACTYASRQVQPEVHLPRRVKREADLLGWHDRG